MTVIVFVKYGSDIYAIVRLISFKLHPIWSFNVNTTEEIVAMLLQLIFQNSIKKHKSHEIKDATLVSSASFDTTYIISKLLLSLISVDF